MSSDGFKLEQRRRSKGQISSDVSFFCLRFPDPEKLLNQFKIGVFHPMSFSHPHNPTNPETQKSLHSPL